MVKIPGLDDLKKMGSGLMDSAKALKFGEMVDKVKSGVESVSGKKTGPVPQGDEAIKTAFLGIQSTLNDMMEVQSTQASAIRKMQGQISELARMIDASQKADAEVNTTSTETSTPVSNTSTTEQPVSSAEQPNQSEDTKNE